MNRPSPSAPPNGSQRALLFVGAALLVLLVGLAAGPVVGARAQDDPAADDVLGRIVVERDDGDVEIINRGDFAAGARALPFIGGCLEGFDLLSYYGPDRRVETILDDETRVVASAVIVTSPSDDEGEEQDDDLAWYDAEVVFAEGRPCPTEIVPFAAPRVTLTQGRTTVDAVEMRLPAGSDVAELDGPVAWFREPAEPGDDAVEASADGATYDRTTERATLTGSVTVTSGDRVSQADEVELDEAAGTAVLRGTPARSTEGDDVVEGDTLIYYLDSNAVEVVGRVRGTLTVPD